MAALDWKTADLTAENTFTDWLEPIKTREPKVGLMDFSVTGTWVGTITVQKRYVHKDETTDPIDVESYTSNTTKLIEDYARDVEYRAGFKTGGFTSGSAAVRMER